MKKLQFIGGTDQKGKFFYVALDKITQILMDNENHQAIIKMEGGSQITLNHESPVEYKIFIDYINSHIKVLCVNKSIKKIREENNKKISQLKIV